MSRKNPASPRKSPQVRGNARADDLSFSDASPDESAAMGFSDSTEEESPSDDIDIDTDGDDFEEQRLADMPADDEEEKTFDPFSGEDIVDPESLGIEGDVFGGDMAIADDFKGDIIPSQPLNLEAPEPRPGYEQRWVIYDRNGKPDLKSIRRSRSKGWFPRRGSTIPKGVDFPVTKLAGYNDSIIKIDGHVLCEMPVARAKQRKAEVRMKADRQMASVKEDLLNEGNQRGVPVDYQNRSTVKRGTKRPAVAANRN